MNVLRTVTTYPREAFGLSALGAAAIFAAFGLANAPSSPLSSWTQESTTSSAAPSVPAGPPPAAEPLELKEVAPEDARAINALVPFSALPNPKARPLKAKFADNMNEARALECLTAAVYYEAAIEGADGQRAVAQVVLNRLRHPAYPGTVCGVVFQGQERSTGCQFTFTCDGSLTRAPHPALWERARKIAWAALSGQVFAPVGWATHYHTDWVVPYWASSLAKAAKVGTHIFYRWTGGWGRPPAFTGAYRGVEPSVAKLAGVSSAHAPAATEVAAATDGETDELAAGDEVVVEAASEDRVTMRMNVASGNALEASATDKSGLIAPKAGTLLVGGGKPADAKASWELRWALTGSGPSAPEPALGPMASATKACPVQPTEVKVVGSPNAQSITVREKCGV